MRYVLKILILILYFIKTHCAAEAFISLTIPKEPSIDISLIDSMTIEEKVGQILMVHFHGDRANQDSKELIENLKIGGIIYYSWANELSSAYQVQRLSAGLQKQASRSSLHLPLLIAIDQEGGVIARLQDGFTDFPGNGALGRTDQPKLAEQSAYALGQELKTVGINMNLAPVVDVNLALQHPVIGVRSFGTDPHTVCQFAQHALKGYQDAQVIATLKHFPGHGGVQCDSHTQLPHLQKSLIELEKTELVPFKELAPSVDVIMTAHLLVPALDPHACSTLSGKTLCYLRENLGFQGVILSDSLAMQAILDSCMSFEEAAIEALQAGCDMLLLGGKTLLDLHSTLELGVTDIQRIHQALVNAVKVGRISTDRLNQAVARILALKAKHLLPMKTNTKKLSKHQKVTTFEHQQLAQQIACAAVQITEGDTTCCGSLQEKNLLLIAPGLLYEKIRHTQLLQLAKITNSLFFQDLNPSNHEMVIAKRMIEQVDAVMIFCYNAWKYEQQARLIQSILDFGKPVILISTRDPLDHLLFPQATLILTTFSPSLPSLQAVYKLLSGERT